jgi:hypothetical protein
MPLDVIMREIKRWYDTEIIYENRPIGYFNVKVSRNIPVSKLLHVLEATGRVHFKVENGNIIVTK